MIARPPLRKNPAPGLEGGVLNFFPDKKRTNLSRCGWLKGKAVETALVSPTPAHPS
jgi:hypothetical protein